MRASLAEAAPVFLILLVIAAIYAAPVFRVYLYSDEMNYFHPKLFGFPYEIQKWAELTGRPVTGLVMASFERLLFRGEDGLQLLRLGALAGSMVCAAAAYGLMRWMAAPRWGAALLVVFVWSQPSVAVHHAYLALLPYWVGIFAAMAAFALFYARRGAPMGAGEALGHFALFMLGMLTFQAAPFFVLPFMAYFVLGAEGGAHLRRMAQVLAILVGCAALYTAAFKLGSAFFGIGTYRLAAALMSPEEVSAFLGPGYLNVFEFWNYPAPVAMAPATKLALLAAACAGFCALAGAAAFGEIGRDRARARVWLMALLCLGLCYAPIAAGGADGRQHVSLAAAATWILIAYRAVGMLVERARPAQASLGALRFAAGALVAVVALGAGLGLDRSITRPYADYFTAIQEEIRARAGEGATDIVVDRSGVAEHRLCKIEPCSGFYGRTAPDDWPVSRPRYYKFAAFTAGLPLKTPVSFLELGAPQPSGDEYIVIDWRRVIAGAAEE